MNITIINMLSEKITDGGILYIITYTGFRLVLFSLKKTGKGAVCYYPYQYSIYRTGVHYLMDVRLKTVTHLFDFLCNSKIFEKTKKECSCIFFTT